MAITAKIEDIVGADKDKFELLSNQFTLKKLIHPFWIAVYIIITNTVNYINGFYYSFIVCNGLLIVLVSNAFFLYPVNKWLSKIVFIIACSSAIVFLNYLEGILAGNYFFLFLLLFTNIFMFPNKEVKTILSCNIFVVICLIIVFTLFDLSTSVQAVSAFEQKISFKINVFVSAIFLVVNSFTLLSRTNFLMKSVEDKEAFLSTIYNSSLEAVLILDYTTLNIISCNEGALKMLEIKGKFNEKVFNINDFINQNNEAKVKRIISNKLNWQGEVSCTTHNGLEFHSYLSMTTFKNNGKKYKKVSLLDITVIKNTQSQLIIEKEKAEQAAITKSKFLSNMSHELRTPLNGIIGTSNLLQLEKNIPDNFVEHFDTLSISSKQMLGLINDILDFSKIEADKMLLCDEPFYGQHLLYDLKKTFKNAIEAKGLEFKVNADKDFLTQHFKGDTLRITQVLNNIIGNAIKFTNEGVIELGIKLVTNKTKFATIEFAVADSGIGIPEDKRKLVFESFAQADTATTRKYGGTGLGLSISKKIVELYNGSIQVGESIYGGSLFTFNICLSKIHQNEILAPSNEQYEIKEYNFENLKVLVAEDNPINMKIATKFLNKWNITPTIAVNGRLALDEFNKSSFDIVFVDLEMPEMDGYEFLKQVKQQQISIPIIAFTAAAYENMRNDLMQKGFNDYLQKPFKPNELFSILNKYCATNNAKTITAN
jgi:signal transduction histidine kinase/CheY-like chemotaxis protein